MIIKICHLVREVQLKNKNKYKNTFKKQKDNKSFQISVIGEK